MVSSLPFARLTQKQTNKQKWNILNTDYFSPCSCLLIMFKGEFLWISLLHRRKKHQSEHWTDGVWWGTSQFLSQHNKHTRIIVIRDHLSALKHLMCFQCLFLASQLLPASGYMGVCHSGGKDTFHLRQYQRLWGKAKQNKAKQNFLELWSTKLTAMAKVLAGRAGHAAWRSYSGGWEMFMPGLVGSGISTRQPATGCLNLDPLN